MSPEEVRLKLRRAGFSPIPLNGKNPGFNRWQKQTDAPEQQIRLWSREWPEKENTGVLTARTPTIDLDILNPDAAEAAARLVREHYEEKGRILVRFGSRPKRAIFFRTNTLFDKIVVTFVAEPGARSEKIEMLADGQQAVVHGIHPDTGRPYEWFGGSLDEIQRDELPYIHAEEAQELVNAVVALLVDQHGYRVVERPKSKPAPNGDGRTQANWVIDYSDHDQLVAHAMQLIASGMGDRAVVNNLSQHVEALTDIDPDRKARRLGEIPAIVASAQDKLRLEKAKNTPKLEPPPDRTPLLLANWITLKLPPRDYLLGDVLCTTSRWVLNGDTGIGKTLLGMEIAGAVSAGADLLSWQGSGQPRRVMYLDGEMPAETFKERAEIIGERYGADLQFWGFNRDVLSDSDMPPINTPEGEAWLLREIEQIKPHLIVFDSIMSLTVGPMSDEESWAPVNLLMRKVSSMRIAQIWLHHTGHDASRGFGTKTREWQVDTVAIMLANEDAVELRFNKKRLARPQFTPKLIRCEANGWVVVGDAGKSGKPRSQQAIIKAHFLRAYDHLAEQ